MTVQTNSVVSLEYNLKDDNNTILDTTKDGEVFEYIHGLGMIIPGLEQALDGKTKGDSFSISIEPKDAYGEKNPEAVQPIPKEHFSNVGEVSPGMQFELHSEHGNQVVTVTEVSENDVTVDANHPFAGMTLHFDVEVVGVREATSEELDHGHIHGSNQHDHE
jgi:FKBP-type peptidyl-prolyl cis-trans isomerase SlyD